MIIQNGILQKVDNSDVTDGQFIIPEEVTSIFSMAFLFSTFAFLSYFFNYPLPHLFVPISIWAAYLFRMHGASLAIFLMTSAFLTFAVSRGYEGTSLISLITFIGVTVAASLIIAAVVNERDFALSLLHSRNTYLENEADAKEEILEHVKSEVIHNRQFKSENIILKKLQNLIEEQKGSIAPDKFKLITELFERLK